MSSQAFELVDVSGIVRFRGTAIPPIGGGGAAKAQAFIGDPVLVADGAHGKMTWDNPSGDDLLDLTNPAAPSAKVAGLYIVAAKISAQDLLTIGGCFEVVMTLSGDPVQGVVGELSPQAIAARQNPFFTITVAVPMDVGGTLDVDLINRDGAAARHYALERATVAVIPR